MSAFPQQSGPMLEQQTSPETLSTEQLKNALTRRGLSIEGSRSRLIRRLYDAMHMVTPSEAQKGNIGVVPCTEDGAPRWWAQEWYDGQLKKRRKMEDDAVAQEEEAALRETEKRIERAAERTACMRRRNEYRSDRCLRALDLALQLRPIRCASRVLHVGCGDGLGTLGMRKKLSEACPGGGELVGIDRCSEKLAKAEILGAASGDSEWSLRFERGDAEQSAAGHAKRFDIVVVVDILHSTKHSSVFGSCAECLKDGGVLVIVDWGDGAYRNVLESACEVLQTRALNAKMMDPIYNTLSEASAREQLSAAQFDCVSVQSERDALPVPPPIGPWLCRIVRPYIAAFEGDASWMEDFELDLKAAVAERGLFKRKPTKVWSLDGRTLTAVCVRRARGAANAE
eukprot:TRINITY_DN18038_c0_g1_i1.p1 TRINITY_DN18038_c0_g1~~TRINITY_DN18038_c0_g1_i1.p1  ORF type:complete len:398 (+),score=66.97 TRINITY_DN18038_c0_g1_i1:77-1270(+)